MLGSYHVPRQYLSCQWEPLSEELRSFICLECPATISRLRPRRSGHAVVSVMVLRRKPRLPREHGSVSLSFARCRNKICEEMQCGSIVSKVSTISTLYG